MSKRKIQMLSLLAVPAIAIALVAFLSWGLGGSSTPKAAANQPHAGVDFHIEIDTGGTSAPECTTKSADVNVPTPAGPLKCNISSGAKFTVKYFLDGRDAVTYSGYDTKTTYTGVVSQDNGATQSGAGLQMPECDIPATLYTPGVSALIGCAEGVPHPIPSSYTGQILTLGFTCTASGTISLKNGTADTSITDAAGTHATDLLNETLSINCPTPTMTPTFTQTATATNTPTNTPTSTPPPVPRWMKQQRYPYTNAGSQCPLDLPPPGFPLSPPVLDSGHLATDLCKQAQDPPLDNLGNLWLTRQGTKIPPLNCQQSSDNAVFSETLQFTPHVPDSKGVHQFAFIGGFEFEVRFDPKLICVDLVPGEAANDLGLICFVDDMGSGQPLEGIARMGCVSKAKNKRFPKDLNPTKVPTGTIARGPELAQVWVKPQPDLYSQIRPNQDNGVVAQLLDQNCELSDEQGHPIPIFSCEDADVTIRYLEGDVEPNCKIDAADQQNVAFRWGAALGSLLYNTRYDLEPSGTVKGDGDVDIKDLQFVFGRFNSGCGRKLDNDTNRPLCDSSIPPKVNATPVVPLPCSGHVLKALPQDTTGSPHPRQAPRNPKG